MLRKNVKNLNEDALYLAENLVNVSVAAGSKWQKVLAKSLNVGTDMLERQQDLALNTVETVAKQVSTGNKRIRKLIQVDPQFKIKWPGKKITTPSIKGKVKAAVKKTTGSATIDMKNLKTITGVGPKIESMLNEFGIKTIEQLAKADLKDLRRILDKAGPRFKMHNPALWKKQANLVLKGQQN